MTGRLQDSGPFAGHSPELERPLAGYGVRMGSFTAAAGGFAAWLARSNRPVPDRREGRDLALVAVATYKASRLLAKDRVASTVHPLRGRRGTERGREAARGRGLRRAIGALIVCPYCLGVCLAAAFTAGLLVAPRLTRWVAATLNAVIAADVLQIAYAKAEQSV
jgi:hypothetical protein